MIAVIKTIFTNQKPRTIWFQFKFLQYHPRTYANTPQLVHRLKLEELFQLFL